MCIRLCFQVLLLIYTWYKFLFVGMNPNCLQLLSYYSFICSTSSQRLAVEVAIFADKCCIDAKFFIIIINEQLYIIIKTTLRRNLHYLRARDKKHIFLVIPQRRAFKKCIFLFHNVCFTITMQIYK